MNALVSLSDDARLGLLALCALASLLQLHAVLFCSERPNQSLHAKALECSVLAALICNFAAVACVHTHITAPEGALAALQPFRFASLSAAALLAPFSPPRVVTLPVAACAGAALPIFETQAWYAPALAAGAAFFALRAAVLWACGARRRAQGLTRDSIAQALDQLPDGLLFHADDGSVLLVNRTMSALGSRLTHRPLRDGRRFWSELARLASSAPGENSLLIRDEGAAWSFSRRLLSVRGRACTLIFAADVTETDRASAELERLNEQLRSRAAQLRETSANLAEIKREQELARLQSRIHDVAGHRIYLLQHYLARSGSLEGLDRFLPLISGLIDDLRADVTIPAARLLDDLKKSFEFIGITLNVSGPLPADERAASALIKIVREAATNAVRHAGASRIDVAIRREGGETVMSISDDGTAPPQTIHEGQGLTGMRERTAELGGTLTVATEPRFSLTVRIPSAEA